MAYPSTGPARGLVGIPLEHSVVARISPIRSAEELVAFGRPAAKNLVRMGRGGMGGKETALRVALYVSPRKLGPI